MARPAEERSFRGGEFGVFSNYEFKIADCQTHPAKLTSLRQRFVYKKEVRSFFDDQSFGNHIVQATLIFVPQHPGKTQPGK